MRRIALLACLSAATAVAASDPPSQKAVLQRAATFVGRYTHELPRLVATETMQQQIKPRPGQPSSGVRQVSTAQIGWVSLPEVSETIAFRDVIEIDGHPVAANPARLVDLLYGGRGTWAQARAILEEGARHNLAPGSRNFNLPTVAAYFLQADRQSRFRWRRKSPETAQVWEMEFQEKGRPTVIRTGDGRSILSRGSIAIDSATGSVIRTRLSMALDKTTYTITTDFELVPGIDLVLPVRMEERYMDRKGLIVTGEATYGNYRRFQTDARLIR